MHPLDRAIERAKLEWEMLLWRRTMDEVLEDDKVIYAKAILDSYRKWKTLL